MKIIMTIILFVALSCVIISSFCMGIMIFFAKNNINKENIENEYNNENDYLS